VSFDLQRQGTPVDHVDLYVYKSNDMLETDKYTDSPSSYTQIIPGVVATVDYVVPTVRDFYGFTFSSCVSFSKNYRYVFLISRSGAPNSTNYYTGYYGEPPAYDSLGYSSHYFVKRRNTDTETSTEMLRMNGRAFTEPNFLIGSSGQEQLASSSYTGNAYYCDGVSSFWYPICFMVIPTQEYILKWHDSYSPFWAKEPFVSVNSVYNAFNFSDVSSGSLSLSMNLMFDSASNSWDADLGSKSFTYLDTSIISGVIGIDSLDIVRNAFKFLLYFLFAFTLYRTALKFL